MIIKEILNQGEEKPILHPDKDFKAKKIHHEKWQ